MVKERNPGAIIRLQESIIGYVMLRFWKV